MDKYSEYKDSGIQWLGKIPSHWEEVRAKYLFKKEQRKVVEGDDIITCFRDGEVTLRKNRRTTGFTEATDYSHYQHICKGDLVIHQMDAFAGSCGVSDSDGMGSPILSICTPITENTDNYYFAHVIRLMGWNNFILSLYRGIRERSSDFRFDTFQKLSLPLPPLHEQQAIVSFLDEKTEKIDTLIAEKEKQLSLLEELKQSEIASAVTRGLNPDAPLKDSGISWLGQIPEHWEILRAKYLYNKVQRPVQEGDEIVTCFRDGEVTLRKNRRTSGFTEATDYSNYQHICKGDLVIHQMDAFAGSSGVSDSDGMGTPVLSVCTPKINGIDNNYFAHILRLMGKNGFILSLYRGIRERSSDFRFDTFSKQWLPVPPISEQQAIVEYIETKLSKINTMISEIQSEIDNLKEYKQSLISDVVTGQIKVS